jgi:hypothetical protein
MSEAVRWGSHSLPEGGACRVEVGPLSIHVRRADGEVRARVRRDGAEPDGHSATDDPPAETRWAIDGVEGIEVEPKMPDRPLIVEPDDSFWLMAGAEARIYVRVPLWVQVEAVGQRRNLLLEEPTLIASDTWWGTPEEGDLCYWLPTRARRVWSPDLVAPHLVSCPIRLVNRSQEALHVQKIALRVAYLSIYRDGEALWADETRVLYTGDAEGSQLETAGRPPSEAPEAARVTEPAERMARGFRARTFRRLRTLTSLFE